MSKMISQSFVLAQDFLRTVPEHECPRGRAMHVSFVPNEEPSLCATEHNLHLVCGVVALG